MADIRHKSRLDEQIDIENEKIWKIEEENNVFQSLKDDQKELKDLENSWFSRWFRSGSIEALRNTIKETKKLIRDQRLQETPQKNLEDLKRHVRTLERSRNGRMERVLWEGFPERLDDNIKTAYLQRFRSMQPHINEDIKCINVTLFGGIGVGKSSFLNTVMTALMNDPLVLCRDFQSAQTRTGNSKTKTFHYEKLQVEKIKDLPIRFYDCPGIDYGKSNEMNMEVLEAVINGHVNFNLKLNTEEINNKRGDTYRKYPSLKNAMHCIVFVIQATTNINHDKILKRITEFQQRIDGPRDVKQVAIVTNIDNLGVPNMDMENVFKYKCVKEICEEVSEFLEIEMQSVHPISNYKEESKPSAAKNALALMALWDIFQCGNRHIQKKLEKRFDDDD